MSGEATASAALLVQSYSGGLTVDLDEVGADVLVDAFAEIARERHRLDLLEADLTIALDRRSPNGKTVARSELRRAGVRGIDRRVDTALALNHMPATHDAFAAGALSLDQVGVLAAAREFLPDAFAADEHTLIAMAADQPLKGFRRAINAWKIRQDPDKFEASRPSIGVSLKLRNDGLYKLEGLLNEEQANTVLKATELLIDHEWRRDHPERECEKAPRDPYPVRMARALVEACRLALSGEGGPAMPDRYRLGWLIDHKTITEGLHDHSICQTDQGDPLPVWRLRQLACEVGILPIVLGGDGIPIDLGREQRFFTQPQKQALMKLDPHCMLDGCLPSRQCKAHHNDDWTSGGLTDVEFGCMLAGGCHEEVHRLGLRVHRAGGYVTFYRPDGSVHSRTKHR